MYDSPDSQSSRGPDFTILIVLAPLLLPLAVLVYIAMTHQSAMAPATTPGAPAAMPQATSIQWTGSLDWALGTARSSNKPLMVEFYADW